MMQTNIFVLITRAPNGFGIAVVAVPAGDTPHGYMVEWFIQRGHTPQSARRVAGYYEVVDVIEVNMDRTGVIAICEWYDGDLNMGRSKITRWREIEHGNFH